MIDNNILTKLTEDDIFPVYVEWMNNQKLILSLGFVTQYNDHILYLSPNNIENNSNNLTQIPVKSVLYIDFPVFEKTQDEVVN